MLPFARYRPNATRCFIPMVSDALSVLSSLLTLFTICMLIISTGLTLFAMLMVTGPLTPTETLSPLKANTCPKLLTSIHCSHAILANSSWSVVFPLLAFFNSSQPSARAFKLLYSSTRWSFDWTKTGSFISISRFRIFRFRQTSEISPYPS